MEQLTLSSFPQGQGISTRGASKVTFSRDTLERKVQSQTGLQGIGPGTLSKSVNLTVKKKFGDVGEVLERDAAASEPALGNLVNYHAKLIGASGRLFDQLVGKLCHLLKTSGKKLEMKHQDTIEALFCSIRTFIVDQEKSDLSRSRLIEILELKARHWSQDGEQPSEDSAPEDRQAEKLPAQDRKYPQEQAAFYYRSGSEPHDTLEMGRRYPSVEEIKKMALATSLPDDSNDEEDNDDQWQTTSYDSDSSEEFVMPAFGEIQDLMQESPSDLDDELSRLLARSIPDSYKRRVNDGKPVRYTKAFLLNCWRSPFSKEMPPVLRHTIAHSDVAFIIQRHAFSDPKQLFTPGAEEEVLLFGCHLIHKKHPPKSDDKKWTQDLNKNQVSGQPSPHPSSTPGQPQPQPQQQREPQPHSGGQERILSWPQRAGPLSGGGGDSLGSPQKGIDATRWDHDAFIEAEVGDPNRSRTRHQSGHSGERSRWDVLRAGGDGGTPNSSRTRHVSVPHGQRSRWDDLGADGDAETPRSSRTRHESGPSGDGTKWDNFGRGAVSRTRHLSGSSGQATQGAVGGVPKRMRHVSGEVKQLNETTFERAKEQVVSRPSSLKCPGRDLAHRKEGHPRVTFSLPDNADEEAVTKAPKSPWKQVSSSANVIQESPGKEQMDVDPSATDQEQTKVEDNASELPKPKSLTPEIHHPGIPTFREIFREVIEKGRTANPPLRAQSGDDLRTPSSTDGYNLRPNYQLGLQQQPYQQQQQQRQLPGASGSRIGLISGDRRTPSPTDGLALRSGGYQALPGSRDNMARSQQQPEPLMQTLIPPPLQGQRGGWRPAADWETPKGSGILGAYPAGARQSLLGPYPGFMAAAPGAAHPSSSNLPYGMGAKIVAKDKGDSAYVPMAK